MAEDDSDLASDDSEFSMLAIKEGETHGWMIPIDEGYIARTRKRLRIWCPVLAFAIGSVSLFLKGWGQISLADAAAAIGLALVGFLVAWLLGLSVAGTVVMVFPSRISYHLAGHEVKLEFCVGEWILLNKAPSGKKWVLCRSVEQSKSLNISVSAFPGLDVLLKAAFESFGTPDLLRILSEGTETS